MTTAFTPAEAARLAAIEAAPDAPESHAATIERMSRAVAAAEWPGGWRPWEGLAPSYQRKCRRLAAAAYRAEHGEGAE